MTTNDAYTEGTCACGQVKYSLASKPMFVHCCHCSWCQRETGSAFALNAMIETHQLQVVRGDIETINIPSNSGKGQLIARCPSCKIAIWSHYGGAKEKVAFVRVGTLINPSLCPPDIHIFTSTQLSWVKLNDDVPQMEEFYRRSEQWPAESIERYNAVLGRGA